MQAVTDPTLLIFHVEQDKDRKFCWPATMVTAVATSRARRTGMVYTIINLRLGYSPLATQAAVPTTPTPATKFPSLRTHPVLLGNPGDVDIVVIVFVVAVAKPCWIDALTPRGSEFDLLRVDRTEVAPALADPSTKAVSLRWADCIAAEHRCL